jgi:tetratricopeptide (TPR) repeat protein
MQMSKAEKRRGELRAGLAERGDLKGALASIDQSIKRHPRDGLLYRERAHLHLYLGHTQQARSDFDVTVRLADEEFRTQPGRLHADSEYNAKGVTYWMEGHRELALAFWRYTTSMLAANRVAYAHMGGGIESGLLLWFGAVHLKTAEDIELVRAFYEQRLKTTMWSHNLTRWPGPIVRFFLKQIDEQKLIEDASGKEHELCEAHFALATRARELGRYAAYRKHLKLVAPEKGAKAIYDFYNCWWYFLAKFELEN